MGWQQYWRRALEHWRFRYLPSMVNMFVAATTLQARKTLRQKPLRILVDNSTIGKAITHETGWVSTGPKKWGDQDVETGYAARVCVYGPNSDSDDYQNVLFLPGIVHLARKELLELCTSAELQDEQFRQPSGRFCGYGSFDYSLLRDIRLRSLDGHTMPTMGPAWMGLPNAKEQQQARLARSGDPLYAALAERLGQKNNLDAWHIATAERYGVDYFLTMDYRLKRLVDSLAKKPPFNTLKTSVITPAELGKRLHLMPVSPQFFSYHSASWFVRPDLHWPDNRRRPLSSYRKARKEHK
ncbi:PIN domain-containing protein [Rhizobium rhizogenes]|uniref:PIN domain-containing protein n=1 Tax=Rhizobium rhizogenes TaxID=359 RepID=UPI00193DF617|nr:PIN domain-containing protein [Rhizobium rhizogenes]QRM40550.1 PIN domain-containing protein [Rhizobium rhizogenes]